MIVMKCAVFKYVCTLPYCYYYKRVLILANIGDLVITAKFCARYRKIMSSITMNIIKIEQLL